MKARIFVLVVLAAGFVMAEDNATTAPGVVAPAVTLAPAVQSAAAPPQPGVLTPGQEIGRTPPPKTLTAGTTSPVWLCSKAHSGS